MLGIKGDIAIVTGGSNGIGEAIVYALSVAGAKVIIADVDVDRGRRVCEHLRSEGYYAETVKTDVTDSKSVGDLITYVADKYGSIDTLINNAGILRDAEITDISDQDWESSIAVNLTGVFYCCRAVVPYMIKAKRGKIINISAADGKQGFPFAGVHYCGSKGGVMALTRQLALQVSQYGINVNAVAPGVTETEMIHARTEEERKYMMGRIPVGRLGRPEDTAGAVLFLASRGGDYILGETIDVNGGLYMG